MYLFIAQGCGAWALFLPHALHVALSVARHVARFPVVHECPLPSGSVLDRWEGPVCHFDSAGFDGVKMRTWEDLEQERDRLWLTF